MEATQSERKARRARLTAAVTCIEHSAAALAQRYGLADSLTTITQHEPPADDLLKAVYLAEDVGCFLADLARAAAGVDVEKAEAYASTAKPPSA